MPGPVGNLVSVPPSLAAAGVDDSVFVRILRDDMDDSPVPVMETFASAPATPWVQLRQYPVWDADSRLSVVSNTGEPFTIVQSRDALVSAGQCYVEYDTGYVYFASAADPLLGGGLTVTHYRVRWLDRRMLNALYAGLKAMFPRIWAYKTFTFTLNVNQWEYQLPSDFYDPRCCIFRVEVQDIPFATERYHRINSWFLTAYNVIHIPWSQAFSPGARVRVHYAGPYTSLAELEPQVQHLPLWYAKGKLLLDKEVLRVRYDLGPVTVNEQQHPPGASANAGIYHLRQFEAELERLATPIPIASPQSTYVR